jgi:hypothetical protein
MPTLCGELVLDCPDFIGVKDASKHGVGGIIMGKILPYLPTVFQYKWPDDIKSTLPPTRTLRVTSPTRT